MACPPWQVYKGVKRVNRANPALVTEARVSLWSAAELVTGWAIKVRLESRRLMGGCDLEGKTGMPLAAHTRGGLGEAD